VYPQKLSAPRKGLGVKAKLLALAMGFALIPTVVVAILGVLATQYNGGQARDDVTSKVELLGVNLLFQKAHDTADKVQSFLERYPQYAPTYEGRDRRDLESIFASIFRYAQSAGNFHAKCIPARERKNALFRIFDGITNTPPAEDAVRAIIDCFVKSGTYVDMLPKLRLPDAPADPEVQRWAIDELHRLQEIFFLTTQDISVPDIESPTLQGQMDRITREIEKAAKGKAIPDSEVKNFFMCESEACRIAIGYTDLFNLEGRIICHPKPALIGADLSSPQMRKTYAYVCGVRAIQTGFPTVAKYLDIAGGKKRKFLVICPVGGAARKHWAVAATAYIRKYQDYFCSLVQRQMNNAIIQIIIDTTVVFMLVALCVYGLADYVSVRMTKPIAELVMSADRIARGDFDHRVDIDARDEFGDLAQAFNAMAGDLKKLTTQMAEEAARRERLARELEIAHEIQMSLVPHTFPPFPDKTDFDLYAVMKPARQVGGDFYDFFMVDDNFLTIIIADVSGKGIPAALFMATTRAVLRNVALTGRSPAETLKMANETLLQDNARAMFVTIFMAVYNRQKRTLTYSCAGHNPPYVIRADGTIEPIEDARSPVLAVIPNIKYGNRTIQLAPGDTVFFYTDGVTEAMTAQRELFGNERLVEMLRRVRDRDSRGIVDGMWDAVVEFVRGYKQTDDFTAMALQIREANPNEASPREARR